MVLMPAVKKPEPKDLTPDEHRECLWDLKGKLEQALSTCTENMLPQLSGQYRATLADLAALPPVVPVEKSKLDELRERRESKHADAPGRGATAAPAGAAK